MEKNKTVAKFDFKRIINRAPGTLVNDVNGSELFEIEVITFDSESVELKHYKYAKDFKKYVEEENLMAEKVRWVNVTGIYNVESMQIFGELLMIEPFVLEQILTKSKHSMYKMSEDFIFNDLQMIYESDGKICNDNFSILVKDKFVITFQERKGDIFDPVRERIMSKQGEIRFMNKGYTYFCLLDDLIDNYLDSLERLRINIDMMEETITNLDTLNVNEIHGARKQLMIIRFSAVPISKMIQQLIQEEHLGVDNTIYIESIGNHIREVESELAIQKETVDGLYQNYILNNSNDMNSVMTTLTVFSAIFIPLSFLAGVFGMNFETMPGLSNHYSFYYFIGGCVLTSVIMVFVFRLKKWF